MSETTLVNAATVAAGQSCAVDGYAIPVPPYIDFRVSCDQTHSVTPTCV
jgi:hypothetical protein